ncbi:MAG: hypothetical protein RRY29_03850 [Desulfovibrionaceae bacterium]
MARKEITVTFNDDGNKLTFRIVQMPATKLESWLIRAGLVLANSGAKFPEGAGLQAAGMHLASQGMSALGGVNIDYEKVKPLLDDLLHCCHRVLDGSVEQHVTESTVDGYITDVRNLFKLRVEALKLNLDFFDIGGLSALLNPVTEKGTPAS